ncbi:MAG: LysM domain-containing protein [Thermodesulfobacteriota bacterium]
MTRKTSQYNRIACIVLVIFCTLFILLPSCFSAVLYRSYVVKYDRGWDILCDSYIVQKNDWVYKIFRQKGEISADDFQEFLSIFERLNPQIRDIDRIRPHENIFIPLKKLEPGTLPGQSSGIVTIPFVSISGVSEFIESYSKIYSVQKGDTISKLIASRFGNLGTRSYREGLNLFRALNPDIINLDLIYTGQNLILPDPAMRNEPWYKSLFDKYGNIKGDAASVPPKKTETLEAAKALPRQAPPAPMSQTADLLDAKLLNRGTYFFPRASGGDFELDLSQYPVIVMEDGRRIVFTTGDDKLGADEAVLKSRWKKVSIVPLEDASSTEQILDAVFRSENWQRNKEKELSLTDYGLSIAVRAQWISKKPADNEGKTRHICITMIDDNHQRTPGLVTRYLDELGIIIKEVLQKKPASAKGGDVEEQAFVQPDVAALSPGDRKIYVKGLIEALGYAYSENISVTFPYAGIQVEAVSNLVTTGSGNDFLIDFGELYGDAAQEIEKTGLGMVHITPKDTLDDITGSLLTALDVTYAVDPLYIAAARPAEFNIILKIPGYLVHHPDKKDTLLSAVPLHNRILRFLNERDVRVVLTGIIQK